MKLLFVLLAAFYGAEVIAAESLAALAAEKVAPAAKPHAHKHKKDCVEKEGQPCHLHDKIQAQKAAEAAKEVKPAPDEAKAAAPATSVVAPVAVPAVVKPEVEAPAVDALALAKKSGCLVCHAVDKKLVGPAWRDVAAKYRGDATAEARLVSKVGRGGSGVWGSMAMPAHPQVSEADRNTLVKFVLNLK
jgi:cytochrome c